MINEQNQINLMLLRQKFRDLFHLRNTRGDRISITENYVVRNGNKILFASKGHIVNMGLINLINLCSNRGVNSACVGLLGWNTLGWSTKSSYMRLGTGGNTTAYNTTSLTTIVNTAADSQTSNSANPSNGVFKLNFIATWNTGTLSAIDVSEIGLFLHNFNNTGSLTASDTYLTGHTSLGGQLFSRISNADGDFTTFTVNTTVPLTITWTLTFAFA